MVVGECGADGLAHLETAVLSEKLDFGGREGVVFGKLDHAVVESLLKILLESKQAEMEVEVFRSSD